MALSDHPTRAVLRTCVRRDLLDTNTLLWSDAQLNSYIDDWQEDLQSQFEFIWGTTSVVGSTSTITLSTEARRLDRVYFNNRLLPTLSVIDNNILYREWRSAGTSTIPKSMYQPQFGTVVLWPPLSTTGTAIFEYPVVTTFTTDTDTSVLPPWTRYTCQPYCCYRAFLNLGPNHDLSKALRYKAKYVRAVAELTSIRNAYLPTRSVAFRPAGTFEHDLLEPPGHITYGTITSTATSGSSMTFHDYSLTGTLDGVNNTFTVPVTPTEMQLFRNGLLLKDAGTDYTRTGNTIVFAAGAIPQVGDTLVAWVAVF